MEFLLDLGYFGLFAGAFLAATILPFSSDFLLLGILAAGGDIVWTVVWASLGNWAGGMFSYYMGYFGKWEWMERWFKVKQQTLEKQKAKIDRWGSALAFLSWLPFVGDLFAIGLGFYRVNAAKVALYMLIGKTARFVGWALAYKWFMTIY